MPSYYSHLGQDNQFIANALERELSYFQFSDDIMRGMLNFIEEQYRLYENFNQKSFEPQDCLSLIKTIAEAVSESDLPFDHESLRIKLSGIITKAFLTRHLQEELQNYTLPVSLENFDREMELKEKLAEQLATSMLETLNQYVVVDQHTISLKTWSEIALNRVLKNIETQLGDNQNLENLGEQINGIVVEVKDYYEKASADFLHLRNQCRNKNPLSDYLTEVQTKKNTLAELGASLENAQENEKEEIEQNIENTQNDLNALTDSSRARSLFNATRNLLQQLPRQQRNQLSQLQLPVNPYENDYSDNGLRQLCPPPMSYSVCRARLREAIVPFSLFNFFNWFKNRNINKEITALLEQNPALPNEAEWLEAYESIRELKHFDEERAQQLSKTYLTTEEKIQSLCLTLNSIEKNKYQSAHFRHYYGDVDFRVVSMLKPGEAAPKSIKVDEIILQQNNDNTYNVYWQNNGKILSEKISTESFTPFQMQLLPKPGKKSKHPELIAKIVVTKNLARDDRKRFTSLKAELANIRVKAQEELSSNKATVFGMSAEMVYANMQHRLETVFAGMEGYLPSAKNKKQNAARHQFLLAVREQLRQFKKLPNHEELLLDYSRHWTSQQNSRQERMVSNWNNVQEDRQIKKRNQRIKAILPSHPLLTPTDTGKCYEKDSYKSVMRAHHVANNENIDASIYKDAGSYQAALNLINDDWRTYHREEYQSMPPLYQMQADCEPQGNLDSNKNKYDQQLLERQERNREEGIKKSAIRFFLTPSEQEKIESRSNQNVPVANEKKGALRVTVSTIKAKAAFLLMKEQEEKFSEVERELLTLIQSENSFGRESIAEVAYLIDEKAQQFQNEAVLQVIEDIKQLQFVSEEKKITWKQGNTAVEIREGNHTMFKSLREMEIDFCDRVEPQVIRF